MTCEEYYKTHEWTGTGDRCALPFIEADTARNVAIMSTTTTGCSELLSHIVMLLVCTDTRFVLYTDEGKKLIIRYIQSLRDRLLDP
jgi:hypothetical protein